LFQKTTTIKLEEQAVYFTSNKTVLAQVDGSDIIMKKKECFDAIVSKMGRRNVINVPQKKKKVFVRGKNVKVIEND